MHPRAFHHPIDTILRTAQSHPDEVELLGRNIGDGSPVGRIMAGGEQLLRIDRSRDTAPIAFVRIEASFAAAAVITMTGWRSIGR